MTSEQFKKLIELQESATIDFKAELYDFATSNDKATSKFIKDVVSLCNTPRQTSSYIVFGIKAYADGSKEMKGLLNLIDDATLQEKIKDKVSPVPKFSFSPLIYESKVFGIIELPIHPYIKPVEVIKKMEGLELNKVYYRRGSSNSEANISEVLEIGHWLKQIKNEDLSVSIKKNNLLKKILEEDKLSKIVPDIIEFADFTNDSKLRSICTYELNRYYAKLLEYENAGVDLNHRLIKVFVSLVQITHPGMGGSKNLKRQMELDDNFHKLDFLFPDPIYRLESYYERATNDTYATLEIDGENYNDKLKGFPLQVYIFPQSFASLVQNIKSFFVSYLSKN